MTTEFDRGVDQMKTSKQSNWTLSKPLTNQILADDLRRGNLAVSIYGIDIPEDSVDRIHFGAVVVFGDSERADQIVTEHNQHSTLIEQRERLIDAIRDVAIRSLLYCEQKYDHDDQARLNLEALLESVLTTSEQEGTRQR